VTRARTLVAGGVLVVGLVLVAVLASGLDGATRASLRSPMVGHHAPSLSGRTLSGSTYTWRPAGNVTVVNIWASWCGPCRKELPLVARSARSWAGHGVRVVTIDTKDGPVAARTLLQETHADGLRAVQDPKGRLAVSWGATGVPETVVVDARGIVRARWTGALDEGWLRGELRRWARA